MPSILLLCALALMGCATGKVAAIPDEFDPQWEFDEANRLMSEKRYDQARELLNDISRRDATLEYASMAQLRMADMYVMKDENETAAEEYRRFLELYPRHKYSPYAQYKLGMLYYDQVRDPHRGREAIMKSLEAFNRLNSAYPRSQFRGQASLRIRELSDMLAEYEFSVGEYYFKREAYKGAVRRFEDLLASYPGYRKEPEALYLLTRGYDRLAEPEKARAALDTLAERFPDHRLTLAAREELAHLLKPE